MSISPAPQAAQRFDYTLFGTHVRFGDGVAAHLADELALLGVSRPLVLRQDRSAESLRYRSMLGGLQSLRLLECGGIPPHSDTARIEEIAGQARDFGIDCVVAFGGGSVADSAKAVALLLAEGGRLTDHVTAFTPPAEVHIPLRTRPWPPIISLPTTASGAENTPSFGVRDAHGEKLLFWNRQAAATVLLIDPLLSEDVAPQTLRYTAMNGIAHCIEGLYSTRRSPVSDGMAVQALLQFQQALETPGMEPGAQRAAILQAGHLAGMVLSMARSCLHHAICHVIGARHLLGHGLVNTVMLPHALRFNEAVAADCLAPALAAVNGRSRQPYGSLSQWLEDLAGRLGMPARLSDIGLRESDLPPIARQTLGERGLALNPRPVNDASDILAILHRAFA